jgi:hypothetical protein
MSWGAPKRREGIRAAGGRVLHCVAADGIMRSGLFELNAWRCIFLWVTGCSRLGCHSRTTYAQYQVPGLLARVFRGHHSKF